MRSFIRIIDQKGMSILVLVLTDVFAYFLSFLAAYFVRSNLLTEYLGIFQIQSIELYVRALPIVFLIMLFVFYTFGLYERKNRIDGMVESYHVMRAVTFAWLLVMAASFLAKIDYSRVLVVLFWIISLVFMNLGRLIIRHVKLAMIKRGYGLTRVLI